MKLYITILSVAVFVSIISICSSFGSEKCNEFVDEVLSQLKEDKDFFQEPYEIPIEEKSFGIYEVQSGYVYGLSTLHRTHDVLPLKDGYPYLKVFLLAGELKLKCSVQRKFLNFGKSANVDANIPFASIELNVVPKPDGSDPEIKAFKVDEVKGLTVKVSGVGLVRDFFLNAFVYTVGRFFKNLVRAGIEDRLIKFLENKVKNFTIPAKCLNEALD